MKTVRILTEEETHLFLANIGNYESIGLPLVSNIYLCWYGIMENTVLQVSGAVEVTAPDTIAIKHLFNNRFGNADFFKLNKELIDFIIDIYNKLYQNIHIYVKSEDSLFISTSMSKLGEYALFSKTFEAYTKISL